MLTCRDEADYMELQGKLANYEAAVVLLYGKDKRCFSPEEITALGVPIPSNDERSAVEAWEFQHTQRDRYTAYVDFDKTKVTTWTGQLLGTITKVGREWRDSFGGKRIALSVLGINGVHYHGTYFVSSGDYCHLKARRHHGAIITQP